MATELLPSQEMVIGITSAGGSPRPPSAYSSRRIASSIFPLAWWMRTFFTSASPTWARSRAAWIAPATELSAYL